MRRRDLLGLTLAGGLLAGCGDGDGEATPSATDTPTGAASGSPSGPPDPATDDSFVPEGLSRDQLTVFRYGEHYRQVSDLWVPVGEHAGFLVVAVHGGGWDDTNDRRDLNVLVADLVGRGYPTLNVDYRGFGENGGWPGTFTDTGQAVDLAADAAAKASVPADRIAFVGHSAGGHLAMWAAARHTLAADQPAANPRVTPALAASLAGVLHPSVDYGENDLVEALFGGLPDQQPDRFAYGDPSLRVPYGMPLFAGAGLADEVVPVSQTQFFADAVTRAGDTIDVQLLDGATHDDAKAPDGPVVPLFRDWLEQHFA
ncbi:alpha/beta hydrolase family protein [Kineococcus rhizosphaerae]|uniref:Acetyl esterase/lipase n=1 Tax=Kineococcus rhizosphaerae TaxID=559628 RepID=A0A2T0R563_9ACTN|nr:alpha/beta hydrolase [Kineococcus rhizosphaerae]PRY15911.1 acetyl esterase/lipase [Kineococcus rhizosphaerae]